MTLTLPPVDELGDTARDTADTTSDQPVNLVVEPSVAVVNATGGTYHGADAAAAGCLAAATTVVDGSQNARLHHPDPTAEATGPWLVVAPLAGHLSTVAAGSGRATVSVGVSDENVHTRLGDVRDAVDAVLTAAQPSHDVYPVAEDNAGVFTTGMTTFDFNGVAETAQGVDITFDVSITPATTTDGVEATFEDIDAVTAVDYEPTDDVAVAEPTDECRERVEDAVCRVLGDAQYEWLPGPGTFSSLANETRFAFGMATPGTPYDETTFERDVEVLTAIVETLGGVR